MHYETLLLVVRNAGRFSGTGSRPPLNRGARLRRPSGRPLRCWQAVSLAARPDAQLARAWAEIGQGWATLSHAEAARSIAAAAFAVDQGGVTTVRA